MRLNQKTDISLIGSGALGSVLAKALYKQGYAIHSIYNRTVSKAVELAEETGKSITGSFPGRVEEIGKLVVIAVPDDFIRNIAIRLSELHGSWKEKFVVHCSGVHTSDLLDHLKDKGAVTAAFHPIQTFRSNSSPSAFAGITFDIEGDPIAFDLLETLSGALGGRPVIIDRNDKILVHLAAVFVCNYQVTLAEIATTLLEKASHMELNELKPLMQQTLDNIIQRGSRDALTGPLLRGDVDTIAKHLSVLDEWPEIQNLYKLLGKFSLENIIKTEAGDERFEKLNKLLSD